MQIFLNKLRRKKMMDSSHHMMFWNLLVTICLTYADVIREDGYHNYEGQFTVEHKGRMLRVLMYFRNVQQELCALRCVQHLRCRTFNYHHGKKDCELTDEDFDEMNVETFASGWYNYGTPKKVDGGWSSWSNYTVCTKTCGSGTIEQWSDCDSPEPEHGGADCKGRMRRRMKCNTHGCPVNVKWSSWRNSTNCTKPCGNGTLVQERDCVASKPEHSVANCTGVKMRTVECNTNKCPANVEWSSWRNYTNCSKTCGNGTLVQVRDCDASKSEHSGANCTGVKMRTVECNTHGCPVNGGWSSWRNVGQCTKSCGRRTLTQVRDCDSPQPGYGGDDCIGEKKRTVNCNNHGCQVVNVAKGKKASQSSVHDNNRPAYGPSNAIDGSTISRSITKNQKNPWWKVDMGKVYAIKYIHLHAPPGRELLIHTRGNDAWHLCKKIGDLRAGFIKFRCDSEVSNNARHFKINSPTKCQLTINEVKIYSVIRTID